MRVTRVLQVHHELRVTVGALVRRLRVVVIPADIETGKQSDRSTARRAPSQLGTGADLVEIVAGSRSACAAAGHFDFRFGAVIRGVGRFVVFLKRRGDLGVAEFCTIVLERIPWPVAPLLVSHETLHLNRCLFGDAGLPIRAQEGAGKAYMRGGERGADSCALRLRSLRSG